MKIFSKTGYHSSPYEMDKFENKVPDNRAKTGEGAMKHGYGLYIQADKTINTERYKERLSGIPLVNFGKGWVNGKDLVLGKYATENEDEYFRIYDAWNIITDIWSQCRDQGYSIGVLIDEGLEKFKEYMNRWIDVHSEEWYKQAEEKDKQEGTEIHKGFVDDEVRKCRDSVNLLQGIKMNQIYQYTVEFPDDMIFAEENLDCAEQSGIVRKAIRKRSYDLYSQSDMYEDDDWDDFYRQNCEFDKSGYEICKFLSENGVDGIHYNGGLDGECWVVFNCEKVKIISKE